MHQLNDTTPDSNSHPSSRLSKKFLWRAVVGSFVIMGLYFVAMLVIDIDKNPSQSQSSISAETVEHEVTDDRYYFEDQPGVIRFSVDGLGDEHSHAT